MSTKGSTRRDFLKALGLGAAALALPGGMSAFKRLSSRGPQNSPNFVLILVDDLVSNGLDLLPTLCDYAGIRIPDGLPGSSARPLAEGQTVRDWRDHVVVESQNGIMIRTDRFKYCIYDSGEHRKQLVDLKIDPGETRNLADDKDYKEILDKHHQLLKEWVKRTGDTIGSKYVLNG